jgi:CubicO group peptidase (beta-lactamase class C family)
VPPDKASITIHQLLTHTAGFTRDHLRHDLIPMDLDEAPASMYGMPVGFAPAGLSSTGFFGDDWSGHDVAVTYFNGEWQGRLPHGSPSHGGVHPPEAVAGLRSSG